MRTSGRRADTWPPSQLAEVNWYLHSAGRANSRFGDGALSTDPARRGDSSTATATTPRTPCPTIGGRTFATVTGPGGVRDQSELETRNDVLVYTSAPPARVPSPSPATSPSTSGSRAARPTPTSPASSSTWSPDGYCAVVADGILRARFRNSFEEPEFLEPGEVDEADHRPLGCRLHLQAGTRAAARDQQQQFPPLQPQPQTRRCAPSLPDPMIMRVAIQQVFHDAGRPSRLTLPVVDEDPPAE